MLFTGNFYATSSYGFWKLLDENHSWDPCSNPVRSDLLNDSGDFKATFTTNNVQLEGFSELYKA